MKQVILFSFLIALNSAFAQTPKPVFSNNSPTLQVKEVLDYPKFEFGVIAGINAGAPIPNKVISSDDKGGAGNNPRIGLQVQYNINKRFSILAEWAYSHKSATFESKVTNQEQAFTTVIQNPPYAPIEIHGVIVFNGTTVGNFDLEYLEMQLLPQYSLNKRLAICAGAYGADLWRGTNKGVATDVHLGISTQRLEDIPFDNSTEIQRFDYGAVAGVSYKLFNNLHLNFRATRGFASLYKPTFTRVDYTIHNTYIQLGADFRLPSRSEKYALVF